MNGATLPGLALAAALLLAATHILASHIRLLHYIPRSRWLSFAGGVSVAYVFVHLLPELAQAQQTVGARATAFVGFAERHVYVIALIGLMTFYALDSLAVHSRRRSRVHDATDCTTPGVFWIHIASFSLYNGLIGYIMVHGERETAWQLLLFTAAMALHFIVNDAGLREHHKERYQQRGRWLLGAAVLLGWGAGALTQIPEPLVAVLLAFLAGGVILNVLKEEVPQEHESRLGPFAVGAGLFGLLLLAL